MRKIIATLLFLLGLTGPALATQNPNWIAAPATFGFSGGVGPLSGFNNLQWISGINGNGVANNCTPMTNAMTYAVNHPGTVFLVPNGTYGLTAATCPGFSIPNNTALVCQDPENTVFKILGAGPPGPEPIFLATEPNNVWFINCGFYGNNNNSGHAQGAIYFHATGSSSAVTSHYGCINCHFHNFQEQFWVAVTNDSTFATTDFEMIGGYCQGLSGNNQGTGNVAVHADCIAIQGMDSSATGLVLNFKVTGMIADLHFIKSLVTVWSGAQFGEISGNVMNDCANTTSSDKGGYCVTIYNNDPLLIGNSSTYPSDIVITNNVINATNSAGVYTAQANRLRIANNYCTGQTDSADGTLVKGCFGLNNMTGEVIGNVINNSFAGIETIGSTGVTDKLIIAGNQITGAVAGAKGIRVEGRASNSTFTILADNYANLTDSGSYGIKLEGSAAASLAGIRINGGFYGGGHNALDVDDGSGGSVFAGSIDISNATFGGAVTSRIAFFAGTTSTPISMTNDIIDGSGISGNPDGLVMDGATAVRLTDLTMFNFTAGTGHSFSGISTTGTITNMQFVNVSSTRRVAATSLGLARPGFSWDQGGFVMNLAAACSAGSATLGWGNDNGSTTWTTRVVTCS